MNRHLMETQNLVISFDFSWFLAKNLVYAECRIMKFQYRNSSIEHLCYKCYIFFSFRDMHEFECGRNYVGLCENMTSINGETLLKFLRNVSFTGEWFFTIKSRNFNFRELDWSNLPENSNYGRESFLRCKGKTLLSIVKKLLKTRSLLTSPNNILLYYLK